MCEFLFQLKYALYVIVICIIARAIVKYVNQTVKKPATARQRVHLLNNFTDGIAYIKIIRCKIYNVLMLFRKQKANMDETNLP